MNMPTEGEECITTFQQYYNRPMEIPRKEPLRTFIYNPKTKAVFGRTSSSWRKDYYSWVRVMGLRELSGEDRCCEMVA